MFITFEGIDYSGKSTQARLLHEYLLNKKLKSILLREPGGTKISEKVREILLDKKHLEMTPLTEFLLFSASRSQLVSQIIKPHIEKGYVVICDRYYDSSTAYQGYGGEIDLRRIFSVNDFASGGLKPDLTFLIDISPSEAFKRTEKRSGQKDRMENKTIRFYNRVHKGFIELANQNKKRFVILNGALEIPKLQNRIIEIVNKKLNINDND
ncbi:MAG TPA: dTMP kinase [Ignavibacteria bacterium]|nr:dTMP kinase [Ignavibacteria bacterium]